MSLNQFKKLEAPVRKAIIDRILLRKKKHLDLRLRGVANSGILLVGDQPAPDRPDDPDYHFTPFSALWFSSLYVNLALHNENVPEDKLTWINSADYLGKPSSYEMLNHPEWKHIIFLGGNAEKWENKGCKLGAVTHKAWCYKVTHPAAWKRFHSKEPYPLPDLLLDLLLPGPGGGTRESFMV